MYAMLRLGSAPADAPFMTMFDMTNADYAAAHAEFLKKKEEASKKVEDVKHELGEKWHEIFGKKD